MEMRKDKRNCWLRVVLAFVVMVGVGLTGALQADASSESEAAANAGFTYQIQQPDNQIRAESDYFDLMMTPGQQQTLVVTLSNPGPEPITVNLALNGAKTNRNGVIEYANDEIANDPSLPFDFTDLVTGPSSVELAAEETRDVELQVQMPETSFEGLILGGLQLVVADDDETDTSTAQGTTVVNKYAYVVAIALQEQDVSGLLPDMAWNSAYAGQMNYRNTIFVNFSNVIGSFVSGMTVQAQITPQGSGEVLYESRSTSLRMAPYSFLEYPISMNGDRMEAGMYTAHVMVYVGNQTWEFTEDFEITVDDANQYNERDVGLTQERGLDWQLIAMIVGGFLAVVLLIFFVVRQIRKNNRKKNNTTKKKKRLKQ